LGAATEELHRQSAERIGRSGVDLVVAVGDYAKLVARTVEAASDGRIPAHAYATLASARRRVVSLLKAGDTVLVKASRAIGLDRLVETIREQSARSVNGKSAVQQKTAKKVQKGS
jgi:UDP-N-acetylmuramoyl-tripeptide--D-alanyl-D-alanine ligase